MEKQLQRVTEEQAKKLFDAGFDWECNHFYNKKGELKRSERTDTSFSYLSVARVNAPTVALALKWLRDVKGVIAFVEPCAFIGSILSYQCSYVFRSNLGRKNYIEDEGFDTYELAESALLDELLNLIKTKNV